MLATDLKQNALPISSEALHLMSCIDSQGAARVEHHKVSTRRRLPSEVPHPSHSLCSEPTPPVDTVLGLTAAAANKGSCKTALPTSRLANASSAA